MHFAYSRPTYLNFINAIAIIFAQQWQITKLPTNVPFNSLLRQNTPLSTVFLSTLRYTKLSAILHRQYF